VADKLERLFRTVHPAGRGEYTYREVAEAIRQAGGPTVSPTYIWQLRTGQRTNPSMRHLEALARFFGVPVGYFSNDDTAARVDAELDFLAALRDASVRHIALRAAGLSPQSLAAISEIIEQIRRLEGLPDPPTGPGAAPGSDPVHNPRGETTAPN
jgi:transcriptional regulator with XRE-family HTH domain